jgi:CMP-N-acetylneuraminic acid synthetase
MESFQNTFICIIPAKGNSVRLPGKNLMTLLGKPLIAHSIIAGQASKYISEVYVSTDSEAIAEIASQYGAKVVWRPKELCTDYATTASALKHALQVEQIRATTPYAVLTLQPTNPLRPSGLIDMAIEKFMKEGHTADSLICVSTNRHKLGKIEHGYFTPATYKPGQRSQDLELYYYENGLLYITKASVLIEREDVLGDRVLTLIEDGPFAGVDIDEKIDMQWAEYIANRINN